jgi:hypothetical protein
MSPTRAKIESASSSLRGETCGVEYDTPADYLILMGGQARVTDQHRLDHTSETCKPSNSLC